MFTVLIKSGTCGHFNYDGCDMLVAEIPSSNIPRKGDILEFGDNENRKIKRYLVTEVQRVYNFKNDKHDFGEWINVYVIVVWEINTGEWI